MALNKVAIWRIFTCFVLFGMIQTADCDEIHINQLLGSWYGIGKISSASNTSDYIACCRIQVTRDRRRIHDFRQITTFTQNGFAKRFEGYGNIINSQMRILYPFFEHKSNFTATFFRNGAEVILTDNNSPLFHGLMCRNPFISKQTISAFEELAAQHDATIEYVQHSDCSYKSVSKPILP